METARNRKLDKDGNSPSELKNLLIAILSAISLADFGLGMNTVVLPLYARSLGASIITIGLIIACFGLARILINIPISIISKRFKAQFIHIGMFCILAGAVGYLLSANYYQLFFFRFMEGLGSGIINTSSMILLTKRLYSHEKRAKVLSLYMIARRLSMGAAPFIGALIAYEFSDKVSFAIYAIIMTAGFLVSFKNRHYLNKLHGKNEPEEISETGETGMKQPLTGGGNIPDDIIMDGIPGTGNGNKDIRKISPQHSPRFMLNLKKYLSLFYNFNFVALCFLTFSFFFSRIGSRRELVPLVGYGIMGLNKADIGLFVSVSAVIGVTLTYYSDRIISLMGIKKSIVISFIISAAGILSFIIFQNMVAFGASIILLSAGGGFSGPARNLYLMDSVEKARYEEAVGTYRTLSDLGFVLGPFALGAVFYYFGYVSAYWIVAGIIIFAAAVFGFFAKSFG